MHADFFGSLQGPAETSLLDAYFSPARRRNCRLSFQCLRYGVIEAIELEASPVRLRVKEPSNELLAATRPGDANFRSIIERFPRRIFRNSAANSRSPTPTRRSIGSVMHYAEKIEPARRPSLRSTFKLSPAPSEIPFSLAQRVLPRRYLAGIFGARSLIASRDTGSLVVIGAFSSNSLF